MSTNKFDDDKTTQTVDYFTRDTTEHTEENIFGMTTTLMSMHDNSTNKHDGWCMDSGATTDFCCRIDMMTNIRAGNKVAVRYGDGSKHTIAGTRGTVTMHGANGKPFTRNNVLFMPQLKHNFLSMSKLDDEGFRFVIENKTAKVFKDKTVVLSGKQTRLVWIKVVLDHTAPKRKHPFTAEQRTKKNTQLRNSARQIRPLVHEVHLQIGQRDRWHKT